MMTFADFDGVAAETYHRLAASFAGLAAGRDECAIVQSDGSVERLARSELIAWLTDADLRRLARTVERLPIPRGCLAILLVGDAVRLRVIEVPSDDQAEEVEPRGRVSAGLLARFGGAL